MNILDLIEEQTFLNAENLHQIIQNMPVSKKSRAIKNFLQFPFNKIKTDLPTVKKNTTKIVYENLEQFT